MDKTAALLESFMEQLLQLDVRSVYQNTSWTPSRRWPQLNLLPLVKAYIQCYPGTFQSEFNPQTSQHEEHICIKSVRQKSHLLTFSPPSPIKHTLHISLLIPSRFCPSVQCFPVSFSLSL